MRSTGRSARRARSHAPAAATATAIAPAISSSERTRAMALSAASREVPTITVQCPSARTTGVARKRTAVVSAGICPSKLTVRCRAVPVSVAGRSERDPAASDDSATCPVGARTWAIASLAGRSAVDPESWKLTPPPAASRTFWTSASARVRSDESTDALRPARSWSRNTKPPTVQRTSMPSAANMVRRSRIGTAQASSEGTSR